MVTYGRFISGVLTNITKEETMGFFDRKNKTRAEVTVDDRGSEPMRVTKVRGNINEGTKYALWKAAEDNLAYTPDGQPSVHPDFTRECPVEVRPNNVLWRFLTGK